MCFIIIQEESRNFHNSLCTSKETLDAARQNSNNNQLQTQINN